MTLIDECKVGQILYRFSLEQYGDVTRTYTFFASSSILDDGLFYIPELNTVSGWYHRADRSP